MNNIYTNNRVISFIQKHKEIIVISLILAFAALKVFSYVLLYKDVSSNGAPEEFFLNYTAGKNFVIKGFTKLFFLPDFSTDFQKDSRPIFYTHSPTLPMVFDGLMIKFGLSALHIRLVYSFVSLFGILFLYLFLRRMANIPIAAISSILLIINYPGYLFWLGHQIYSFWYVFIFGYLWARYAVPQKKYLLVPLFFLAASLFHHIIWGYMLMIELVLYFFERDKKLLWFSFLASLGGILSHIVLIFMALGSHLLWQDFWLTLTNRIFSTPTREQLLTFYQANNLVLWGSSQFNHSFPSYVLSLIRPFWAFRFSLGPAMLVALELYILRRGHTYKNIKILLSLFLMGFFWHIFFPAMAQNYGLPFPMQTFLVIFFGFILGDLCELLRDIFKKVTELKDDLRLGLISMIVVAIAFISGKYYATVGHSGEDEKFVKEMTLLENKDYQGKTFFTNIFPTNVAFRTNNWAVGGCFSEGLLNLDASKCYAKFTQDQSLVPDYILLSSRAIFYPCSTKCFKDMSKALSAKYPLVEQEAAGEIMIYRVKK